MSEFRDAIKSHLEEFCWYLESQMSEFEIDTNGYTLYLNGILEINKAYIFIDEINLKDDAMFRVKLKDHARKNYKELSIKRIHDMFNIGAAPLVWMKIESFIDNYRIASLSNT